METDFLSEYMKRLYLILPISFLLFFQFVSFRSNNKVAEKIKNDYLTQVDIFYESIVDLHKFSDSINESNTTIFVEKFKNCKIQYKKIEGIIEYIDPQFCKDYVNGPPLPKLERKVANIVVIEPTGLQAIEELLNEKDIKENKAKIFNLTEKLQENLKTFKNQQKIVTLTDRQIFEATRAEIFRIYTLGLTGYDSPTGLNPIESAKTALEGCWFTMQSYYPLVDKALPAIIKTDQLFDAAVKYLEENKDFNEIDRLYFLKEFINPLYSKILDLHLIFKIETINLVNPLVQPTNYFADNLFDPMLLNTDYFTIAKPKNEKSAVALGKILFFDPVLSKENKMSCASCHHPEKAFTDGKRTSIPINDNLTVKRNSPSLINAVYSNGYFHDLRAARLEDQTEHVIFSSEEFNTNYSNIIKKLNSSQEYKKRFSEAFPDLGQRSISKYSISAALASYIRSLKGFDSEIDKYIRNETENLNPDAIAGYNLFMGKAACGTCHFAPLFNGTIPPLFKDSETEVIGVPSNNNLHPCIDPDLGRYGNGKLLEQAVFNKHAFKTPTVRNVELTSPYMHNGAFNSLQEVMEFYNNGGGIGLGINLDNQTLPKEKLNLNQLEIDQIITFMKALTDTNNLTSKPKNLPLFDDDELNNRFIEGLY